MMDKVRKELKKDRMHRKSLVEDKKPDMMMRSHDKDKPSGSITSGGKVRKVLKEFKKGKK